MRSSTFHKTSLSKGRLKDLEQVLSDRKANYDDAPGVYVRSNKEKDLDLLWQVDRVAKKQRKMTRKQITTSFVAGILCTLFISSMFNNFQNNMSDVDFWQKGESIVNVSPADNKAPMVSTQTYTIKAGDTIDSIVMRFYGVYDVERIKQIQAINNIADPSKIKLGQVLTIPIN